MDSLLSIVQMPAGIPVATFAIGNAGAANAGLFAAALLAHEYPTIGEALAAFRAKQTDDVANNDDPRKAVYKRQDLGSANGTWLNGKRVTRAQAVHGDELRFDTQRFQLLMPGQPLQAKAIKTPPRHRWPWLIVAALALAAGAAIWLLR